jgi:tetratricopeptide (TPR) repeat protein
VKLCISTIINFLMLLACNDVIARTELEKGWRHWTNGDIPEAQSVAENILKDTPTDNEAMHLKSLSLFVQGKYHQAIANFSLMGSAYTRYDEVGRVIVDAYIHLNEPQNALKLAKQFKVKSVDYYQELADKPFVCHANKTFIIPFINDPQLPSKFFPGVTGKINGKELNIRFDTGGPFLVIGKEKVGDLGIELDHKSTGLHGAKRVTIWKSIADEMELGQGLVFRNIPVVIMESLGRYAIFGTNILEQFLSTMDYPNSRFILTPRNRKDLYSEHLALLPNKKETLPFYMWGDHYMFAKGSFNNIDGLNFFFDSGLVALEMFDGQLKQAAFSASKEKLIEWGFDQSQLDKTRFFPTQYPLGVKGLIQENTLIWYSGNLEKDRNFGGVRMDGLISHAFLSKYSWTIDFDKHEYIFGIY